MQVTGSAKLIWPLVTGTFGGLDFIHSLLGEGTDHISQTLLTDLNTAVSDAEHRKAQALFERLKTLIKMVPSGLSDLDSIQKSAQALASQGTTFHLQGQQGPGPTVTAEGIAKNIYPILALGDKIMKTVDTSSETVLCLFRVADKDSRSERNG